MTGIILGACQGSAPAERAPTGGKPIAGITDFNLSEREIAGFQAASDNGSADAAYRLGMYYDFVRTDSYKANAYLERSATLGDNRAKTMLGQKLVRDNDPVRRAEGVRWLEDAANGGDQHALEILK